VEKSKPIRPVEHLDQWSWVIGAVLALLAVSYFSWEVALRVLVTGAAIVVLLNQSLQLMDLYRAKRGLPKILPTGDPYNQAIQRFDKAVLQWAAAGDELLRVSGGEPTSKDWITAMSQRIVDFRIWLAQQMVKGTTPELVDAINQLVATVEHHIKQAQIKAQGFDAKSTDSAGDGDDELEGSDEDEYAALASR
jgi:hypothetical protein